MLSRSRLMASAYSLILSAVAATTAVRADTPFFWDDFDRDVLEAGNVPWESRTEGSPFSRFNPYAYLQDGSLILEPPDDRGHAVARTSISPLGDFSIRTQIKFDGTEAIGPQPHYGPWFWDAFGYWGGVSTSGFASIGTSPSNPNQINPSTDCQCIAEFAGLDSSDIYDRDVHLQMDAIGNGIELFAWYDGTEKPSAPQLIVDERTQFDSTWVGMSLNRFVFNSDSIIPDQRVAVRYFAVLPTVAGDFSASDTLDLEDINLIDQELRGESENRVFDLDDDGLVTGEDRRFLIQDLMGTSFGDSNFDGKVDAVDLNNLALNWQSASTTSWSMGDFTGDGNTNAADLNLLALNWRSGQQAAISPASVPEPTSSLLLVVGLVLGVTNFRHRRA